MRYTVTILRNDIDDINQQLANMGSKKRLETGGRYGYQAIDVYSVDDNGKRANSGVDCNLETGSSRECYLASLAFLNSQYAKKMGI